MTIPESGPARQPLDIDSDELSGVVAARQALGRDAEDEVLTEFLHRTGQAIDARVDQRLADRALPPPAPVRTAAADDARWHKQMALYLALGSIFLGIPVTGVATRFAGGGGIAISIVAWIAITIINIVFNESGKSR
jgi:hypothetical protein